MFASRREQPRTLPCRALQVLTDHLLQRRPRRIDALGQFVGIESADRMLHDEQLGLDLARLGLRQNERTKGFGGDDPSRDTAFFEFDAVVETPR